MTTNENNKGETKSYKLVLLRVSKVTTTAEEDFEVIEGASRRRRKVILYHSLPFNIGKCSSKINGSYLPLSVLP